MSKYKRNTDKKGDQYESTPKILDQILNELNPEKHILFEPFYGSGYSTNYMKAKGFEVVENEYTDFFSYTTLPKIVTKKELVLVSNPPFSKKKAILAKLSELGITKFALLLPIGTVTLKYFDNYINFYNIQLILHKGRAKFLDPITHTLVKGSTSFDVAWVCANLNLSKDLLFK